MASPELNKILKALQIAKVKPCVSLADIRKASEDNNKSLPIANGINFTKIKINSYTHEWVIPNNITSENIFISFHGGGFCLGLEYFRKSLASIIANKSKAKGLIINYPLAPENPYPAALNECVAVYKKLIQQGYDSNKIIFIGDSAGGNLALATLLHLRDNKIDLPQKTILLSPWTDLTNTLKSRDSRAKLDPTLTKKDTNFFAKMYAGTNDLYNPYISPLFANLKDLPPIHIQVGTNEILYDDSIQLTQRLKAIGSPVTLTTWPDMFHVWHKHWNELPEAIEAVKKIARLLTNAH